MHRWGDGVDADHALRMVAGLYRRPIQALRAA
jgi:hypothetical protein